MHHLVSVLFIGEFLLILIKFFHLLYTKGLTFKGGIAFGVLFFVFIPIWVIVLTGNLELSQIDFGSTSISSIVFRDNKMASLLLAMYIFSIVFYLYFPNGKQQITSNIKLNIKAYFFLYLFTSIIILYGSGILEGGNWYINRHNFFENTGAFAVLIAFILNATKVLVISSIIYKWVKNEFTFIRFLVFIIPFSFLDMVLTGNRIYFFCTAIITSLIFLRRYPRKTFVAIPILLPLIFFLGYFASIFRHMRGPLFLNGIPTAEVFFLTLKEAIILDPPDPISFFLGISESVNVNVIYDILNRYNEWLYGATYLKPFLFYIPRSLWEAKPESITVITGHFLGGASLVATIIGEIQMNFSYFGLILLPILLWITDKTLNSALKNYGEFAGIVLFFFGLLFFRMPFSDELLVFVFLIIILKSTNFTSRSKFIISTKNNYGNQFIKRQ